MEHESQLVDFQRGPSKDTEQSYTQSKTFMDADRRLITTRLTLREKALKNKKEVYQN